MLLLRLGVVLGAALALGAGRGAGVADAAGRGEDLLARCLPALMCRGTTAAAGDWLARKWTALGTTACMASATLSSNNASFFQPQAVLW